MKKKANFKRKLVNYFRRTWKNKIFATILMVCGFLSMAVSPEIDATFFVFSLVLGIPIFLVGDNYIVW